MRRIAPGVGSMASDSDMDAVLRGAMVRIHRDGAGCLGWGVLVDERTVVTSASVVAVPDKAVQIDFPLLQSPTLVASVGHHAPIRYGQPAAEIGGTDLSFLILDCDLPAGARPVRLSPAESLRGHRFQAYGNSYPALAGEWIGGVIGGRQQTGWFQMHATDHRFEGLDNYLGAPVWDEELAGVVGIMVGSWPLHSNICSMAPTELILKVLPDLGVKIMPIKSRAAAPKAAKPPKPAVFVASSVEGLDLAHGVHANLQHNAEVTVWEHGVFQLTKDSLTSLLGIARLSDFGVFVCQADDVVTRRGKRVLSARDNVMLELGIFLGVIGRERCFILRPQSTPSFQLPSDLLGIGATEYEASRADGNWKAATSVACAEIRDVVVRLGKRTT